MYIYINQIEFDIYIDQIEFDIYKDHIEFDIAIYIYIYI